MQSQQRMGDMVSVLDESLSGVKLIKGYNATNYIRQKFYDINAEFSRLLLSMARRQQLASPMSEFLGISAVGVILVFGGMLVINRSLNAGEFVAFIAMFSQITRPVRSFIDQFANINQGVAAGERILMLLDTKTEVPDAPDARTLDGLHEGIEFRNVRFSYDGNREVIDGVSFTIRKGETVALVGPSGRRQVDAQRTDSPLLRHPGRRHPDRRHIDPQLHAGEPARPHERRGTGYDPLQRYDRGQHLTGKTRRHARRDRRRGQGSQRPRLHHGDRQGLPDQHRRPRHETVGRPAAAVVDRPRGAEKSRDPDPRRGDLGTRHRERKAGAGCAQLAVEGAHVDRHRPPALHGAQRRQDHRHRPRTHRRAGYARGVDGARRHLPKLIEMQSVA